MRFEKREVLIRSAGIESRLCRNHLGLLLESSLCGLSWSFPSCFIDDSQALLHDVKDLHVTLPPATKLGVNEKHWHKNPWKPTCVTWKIQGCQQENKQKEQTFIPDGRDERVLVGERGIQWRVRDTQRRVVSIDFHASFVQVEPNSIAARDGRIKEGDRILQVCVFISLHSGQVVLQTHAALNMSRFRLQYCWHRGQDDNLTRKKKKKSASCFLCKHAPVDPQSHLQGCLFRGFPICWCPQSGQAYVYLMTSFYQGN